MSLVIHHFSEYPSVDRLLVPSPTLPPATTTNCWRIYDSQKQIRIIIDPAATKKDVQQDLVKSIPSSVQWIFLTHHHRDHIGSVNYLREKCQILVASSEKTASLLSFDVDRILSHNDVITLDNGVHFSSKISVHSSSSQLKILETPGHAPGHLCFQHLIDHWIICGDMLAGEGTILLAPPEGNLQEYFDSLKMLQKKNPSRLFPAHGPSLSKEKIQEYIDHRQMRNTQILQALSSYEHKNPLQIAQDIYVELPKHFLPLAAKQVLCHLQYLETHQKVVSQGSSFIRI